MTEEQERLRSAYEHAVLAGLARSIAPDQRHYAFNVEFAKGRFQEGIELGAYFQTKFGDRALRILDLGAGSGGVSLALSTEPGHRIIALDTRLSDELRRLRRSPYVIASGEQLPFRDGSFDVVLCLETVEHIPDLRTAGKEMMRVAREGGQVMITTPARCRFLFSPDPHFQIRGLMLLPDPLQRHVIVDRLALTNEYDVTHVYWTSYGIVRHFPGPKHVETLVAIPWPGRPRNLRELLWKLFRSLLWSRIVIWKRVHTSC